MTNLTTFNYLSNTIRVVEIDGQPWFVAADVCRILFCPSEIRVYGPSRYTQRLAKDERRILKRPDLLTRGLIAGETKVQMMSFISESGLYKLIMRSDKPEARKFQDWVTREVLPAIRKDGMYVAGEEKLKTGEMLEDEMDVIHRFIMCP